MRVLVLSPYPGSIASTIRKAGDTPLLSVKFYELPVDFIVMFGHRHILPKEILDRYPRLIINIHGSFLPHNRGAYPNLFSWINNTPKGASIHFVDEGIDTGPIIARQEVLFNGAPNTTLASSYLAIQTACEQLFANHWPRIRKLDVIGMEQQPNLGSFHARKEGELILAKLPDGWDTPVSRLGGFLHSRREHD